MRQYWTVTNVNLKVLHSLGLETFDLHLVIYFHFPVKWDTAVATVLTHLVIKLTHKVGVYCLSSVDL